MESDLDLYGEQIIANKAYYRYLLSAHGLHPTLNFYLNDQTKLVSQAINEPTIQRASSF